MKISVIRLMGCLSLTLASLHTSYAEESTTPALAFSSFNSSSLAQLKSSGSVTVEGDTLRLTPAKDWQQGVVLHSSSYKLNNARSFSAHFAFQMSDPECHTHLGADGLAFIIQSNDSTVHAKGNGIGYAGTELSIAVEFDTFFNSEFQDPQEQHIGLSLHGDPTSYSTALSPFTLNDGRTYYSWIEYDGATKMVEVRLADSTSRPAEPVLQSKVDLSSVLEERVYVGFSASTGTCHEDHDIKSFFFHNDFIKAGIAAPAQATQAVQKKE